MVEVKQGYKVTEFGVIPEDWTLFTLGNVCTFENGDRGVNYPSKSDFISYGLPFVNAGHLKSKAISFEKMDYISFEKFEQLGGGKFKKGDILFCLRGTLGKYAVVSYDNIEGAIASSLIIIRPINRYLDVGYLEFYLESRLCMDMIDLYAGGAAQPNLGGQDLKCFSIILPPLREQQVIAQAISEVDSLINSLEKLISKKRDIKTATMQQLLTGKKRLPSFGEGKGYKDTEIGVIPEDWDVVTTNDLLQLLTDFEANGSFESVDKNVNIIDSYGFAWYVRATDLENNISMSSVKFVDEKSYKFLKKTPLFGGELLITKRGEIGKVYLFNSKSSYATLAPNLYLLKLNEKVIPTYLYYFFISDKGNRLLKRNNASSTLGALYKNDVKFMLFSLPPLPEQQAIAQVLSDMDTEITQLKARLEKTNAIKQGMMQELLTGRTRLV